MTTATREIGPFDLTETSYNGDPVVLHFCNCHPKLTFRVAMDTGTMPMMEFAQSAKSGVDSATMEGLAALYSMLQDCIEVADWDAFRTACKTHKVKPDFLLAVATGVWAALSTRPLESGDSSSSGQDNQEIGSLSNDRVIDSSSTSTELVSKKPANVRTRRKTSG